MRSFPAVLAALLLSMTFTPSPAAARSHEAFTALLQRFVESAPDGSTRVRYAAWAQDRAARAALDAYVADLADDRPSSFGRSEAFAYWANLYNAVTLQVVLERYPVASIRDIRSTGVGLDPLGLIGPWRTKRVSVEGRRLSLDDIEHGVMRPTFRDRRVHYAVNCASIGCPDLRPRAWQAATLEADLDDAARAFVNHPRGARIGRDGDLVVSSIYRWYREDFGGSWDGVRTHLGTYAEGPLAAALARGARIASHDYDWALNDAGR